MPLAILQKELLINMSTGRRFPAEWEKQQGILLCFPHNGNDWPGKFAAIQWDFVELNRLVGHILEQDQAHH